MQVLSEIGIGFYGKVYVSHNALFCVEAVKLIVNVVCQKNPSLMRWIGRGVHSIFSQVR